MAEERHGFQAEVGRLLDIVTHSIYSDKSVFLRELVSNAADACDRLRYLAITRPEILADDPKLGIVIEIDRAKRTLGVADNGIGMNRAELIDHLGTIARSGTASFLDEAANGGAPGAPGAKNPALIGQFGIGFYSAFMVAAPVEVSSRKAGEGQGWRWHSEGRGDFAVSESAEAPARGTKVTLHLRQGEDDYLEPEHLRALVVKHSDHIGFPIHFKDGGASHALNSASALWMRPKAEIAAEQYADFYRHHAHAADEPWAVLHAHAEGKIEYTALLFVPSSRPFDLFNPERNNCVKLYVRRVFVSEACAEILPGYLRFVRGIVDSEDLPLSVSREMLQNNPLLAKIRSGLTKKILAELARKAESDAPAYIAFWENFGAVLKEGLYEDKDRRAALLGLARFRSTAGEDWATLGSYLERMRPGQEAIYYLSGENLEALRRSPQLEGFRARGVEVLLLTDSVDEFWIPAIGVFEGKPFKSVTRGGADIDKIAKPNGADGQPSDAPGIDNLIALMRLALKDAVKDVRRSDRLTDSPVCLVADEGDIDINIERLLRQHRQLDEVAKRVLEVNARHPLLAGLARRLGLEGAADDIAEASWLLLEQARIMQGEPVADPAAFARRLTQTMRRAYEE